MIRRLAPVLCAFALLARAFADGPDDQFIVVYNLIQQADRTPDRVAAYRLYTEAQEGLRRIQKGYPTWNERVINYRIRYCADKLASMPDAADAAAKPDLKPAGPADKAVPEPQGEVITQLNEMNARIRSLAADKQALEARLREALTAQPAPIDPRELQAAVERISALQSTNKALLTRLEAQEGERKNLVDKVVAEEAQKALAETRRQLNEQKQAASRLEKERAEVEARLRRVQEESKPLKLENQTLKDQVGQLKSDTEKGRQVAELSARLTKVQAGLDEMRRTNERLVAEKGALEKQLDDLKSRQAEEGIVKIAKLETELAVARADAERNTLKAEELSTALTKEKQARTQLERDNQGLEQRVAQLSSRTAADAEALKTLEAGLAAEKAERANLEVQLKAALERAKGTTGASAVPPTSEQEAQVKGARAEVARLQEALRQSAQREAEVQGALAQESALRTRLQREKSDLERQLAEANNTIRSRTTAVAAAPRATPVVAATPASAALEVRVRQLEKERDDLKQRLLRLSVQASRRLAELHGLPRVTPRERAAEFRAGR